MYVYILTSPLFIGQYRKVILSFPAMNYFIEALANADNSYTDNNKWKITETR